MEIKDKLRDINQDEVWSSDRIEKTEAFIKEFTIGFAAWCIWNEVDKSSAHSYKELLEIYIETL